MVVLNLNGPFSSVFILPIIIIYEIILYNLNKFQGKFFNFKQISNEIQLDYKSLFACVGVFV